MFGIPRIQIEIFNSCMYSLTKVLAMDCEMVGAGSDGKRSILARVSLVNLFMHVYMC